MSERFFSISEEILRYILEELKAIKEASVPILQHQHQRAHIPGGAWQEATFTFGPIVLIIADFVGTIIDLVIIALAVFWIM